MTSNSWKRNLKWWGLIRYKSKYCSYDWNCWGASFHLSNSFAPRQQCAWSPRPPSFLPLKRVFAALFRVASSPPSARWSQWVGFLSDFRLSCYWNCRIVGTHWTQRRSLQAQWDRRLRPCFAVAVHSQRYDRRRDESGLKTSFAVFSHSKWFAHCSLKLPHLGNH